MRLIDRCPVVPDRRPGPRSPVDSEGSAPMTHRGRRRSEGCGRLQVWPVVLIVVPAALLSATSAGAETVQVLAQVTSVDQVLTNIRNWIMGILAGLTVVFLTIGFVRYIFAGGDPGELQKAKNAWKSAGWGFGGAALAPLIVEIFKGIVGLGS